MGTTAYINAKIAESELTVQLLKKNMGFVTPNAEDPTLPAAIAAKLHVTTIGLALHAPSPAKSDAIIRNAASCAMSLVLPVHKIVPGLALIEDSARYLVQFLAIFSHVLNVVQSFWPVGIDVLPFVEKFVQMQRTVRHAPAT